MKNYTSHEPNFDDILSLLSSLDHRAFEALQNQDTAILVVTAVPVSHLPDDADDEDNYDEDDYDDELEDDEDDCCPEYEPSADGTGRCVYACPECGICLRGYIWEEFE